MKNKVTFFRDLDHFYKQHRRNAAAEHFYYYRKQRQAQITAISESEYEGYSARGASLAAL